MKHIYLLSKQGNECFCKNDEQKMKSIFMEVYSGLIRGINTDYDEDDMEDYVVEAYLFINRMLQYFKEHFLRENIERAKVGITFFVYQAKDTFSDLILAEYECSMDMFDPMTNIRMNNLLNVFEFYCFDISVLYVDNFPHILQEKQRLNKLFFESRDKSLEQGKEVHDKLMASFSAR